MDSENTSIVTNPMVVERFEFTTMTQVGSYFYIPDKKIFMSESYYKTEQNVMDCPGNLPKGPD